MQKRKGKEGKRVRVTTGLEDNNPALLLLSFLLIGFLLILICVLKWPSGFAT